MTLNPTDYKVEFLEAEFLVSAKALPLPTVHLKDNKHMLLLLTVHEVFLASGFVAVDSVSRKQIVFQIPEDWPVKAFTVHYIPTKLLDNVAADDDCVSLKFQTCGHLVSVYGRLIPGQVYQLCLNNHVSYHKEFWKTVRDRIVYPLLIDIFYMICLNPVGDRTEFLASAKDLPLPTMHLKDNKHMLLLLAVHEVFLESGFVAVDSVSRKQIVFQIPEDWPLKAFTLHYIPTKLVGEDNVASDDYVSVKFQTCGHLVNVYGRLNSIPDQVYQLCLNNHTPDDRQEFCKAMKDRLVYRLLIDICYKTGLALPPCFMSLPADMKLIILESLPGFDVARMECVCRELWSLSSGNEKLWKQKYEKECASSSLDPDPVVFGSGGIQWKHHFWRTKKLFPGCHPSQVPL